jgi:hypothetical protein
MCVALTDDDPDEKRGTQKSSQLKLPHARHCARAGIKSSSIPVAPFDYRRPLTHAARASAYRI